ncbi:MAG: hypothetical protein JXQ87_18400 [Bacteroidia bacterium]
MNRQENNTLPNNKAFLIGLFLTSLFGGNLHAQTSLGIYSFQRPPGETRPWNESTEFVGLHTTHDRVFVMEEFMATSGPDSNLYLLHILDKKGKLERIDTLSVSGRDLDGLFNQFSFIYGSDNYMGIMGHTLNDGYIYDSLFLIIYNSHGELVLDKRFPFSIFCTFSLDEKGTTTVLGYGQALTSGEIRQYDIAGNEITFLRGFTTAKTPGSVVEMNNKFYGINESGWLFEMDKDGGNFKSQTVDLHRPKLYEGGMPNFDLTNDSNFLVGYRYDNDDRKSDTFTYAISRVDTTGEVLWTFNGISRSNTTFSDFKHLKSDESVLVGRGLIFLDEKGKL